MAFLSSAFLAAIFFIFIILVTQFNSLLTPFVIIMSVVFSLIGVLLGYVITGKEFNILFSGVGVISLAGIVVNNAIVLVDYINLSWDSLAICIGERCWSRVQRKPATVP